MEKDLMISLEGFDNESDATSLGNTVIHVIRVLHEKYQLDLAKLKRVLISSDFAGSLKKVTEDYGHKSDPSYTNSKQAKAIGQMVIKGACEEFTLVLSTDFFFEWFNSDGRLEVSESNVSAVLHRIHHELIHIHEKNVLAELDVSRSIDSYDEAMLLSATRSWSEYLANLKSAESAPEETVRLFIEQLVTIIKEVPEEVESAVRDYQYQIISIDEMYLSVKNRIKLIANSYAYAFGYVDAFGIELDTCFPEVEKSIRKSKLSDILSQLGTSFKSVTELYEQGQLLNYDDFDEIIKVIDDMFKAFGLTLERIQGEDGEDLYIYVE